MYATIFFLCMYIKLYTAESATQYSLKDKNSLVIIKPNDNAFVQNEILIDYWERYEISCDVVINITVYKDNEFDSSYENKTFIIANENHDDSKISIMLEMKNNQSIMAICDVVRHHKYIYYIREFIDDNFIILLIMCHITFCVALRICFGIEEVFNELFETNAVRGTCFRIRELFRTNTEEDIEHRYSQISNEDN